MDQETKSWLGHRMVERRDELKKQTEVAASLG